MSVSIRDRRMAPTATNESTDEELMRRLQAGEERVLGELMERWELPLKRFLQRLLCNESEAEELAQETMVRVFFQRAKFRDGARFSPWILTVAANLARNRRRWWRRHPTTSLDAPPPGETKSASWDLPDQAPDPTARAEAGERAVRVRAAVAELPHELRETLVLFEFEEKSHVEVAGILGCSAKAVEMRLYRAREKLRKTLGPAAGRS